MPKGYGFQEDDVFQKPSNTVTQSPLNVAMNNQKGGTVNLGAGAGAGTGANLGQAANNVTGSPAAGGGTDITSKPDWKDDIKQDEMNAGADDPFEAIKEDKNKVRICEIKNSDHYVTVEKKDWKSSLDSALEYYIGTEEYE